MVKFPEAEIRKFRNMFICRKCNAKVRSNNIKVLQGKITCRKCSGSRFRPVRKK